MAKAKKRKAAKKSAKRSVKRRKVAPKKKVARAKVRRPAPRRAKAPKKESFIDKVTGAVQEAVGLRRKLEGSNTFED